MSDAQPTDDFLPPEQLRQLQKALDSDPKIVGNYHIEAKLGEGGFGTVYRASQQQPVQRTVAIKLLKRGMDSHAVLQRFELERQALAKMNHPGIAQVFDAGISEDGQQYIVMEFVDGTTIVEWADTERLDVTARLRLFKQVCEAVTHAHQKGIIHRDLKPSNVLVTRVDTRAQVKIIDFGIAKAIRGDQVDETRITQEAMWIGTPEYMSPEQAGAENEAIDTRTDVYALGVMLYEVLTGQLPFTTEELRRVARDEVFRVIREQDPPRPSTRLSGVDRVSANAIADQRGLAADELIRTLRSELEWIPLKAMRKEPSHRYQSADQFAEDIANYLTGQPLLAAPESKAYRLRKFLRRYRWQVAASIALASSLVAGTIGTSLMAARARQQQVLAEERFGDVRQLANTFMFELYPKIRNLPGSTPAIQDLVQTSLTYLNKLEGSIELDDHDDLWLDIASAYNRLGAIQGKPGDGNLGDTTGAFDSYKKALDIAERWLAEEPDSRPAIKVKLAAWGGLSAIESRGGHVEEGIELAEQAAELAARLFATAGDRDALREVFVTQYELGNSWFQRGNLAKSQAAFQAAVDCLQASKFIDGDDQLQTDLAAGLSRLGQLQGTMGDWEQAERSHRLAVSTLRAARQKSPDDTNLLRAAAFAHDQLARYFMQKSRVDEALPHFQDNVRLFAQLRDIDPANAQFRSDLSVARQRLADAFVAERRFDQALQILKIAIDEHDQLLKISPTFANRRMRMIFLGRLAHTHHEAGNLAEAAMFHRQGIAAAQKLLDEEPDNLQTLQDLAFTWDKLSVTLVDLVQLEEALQALKTALPLRQQLLTAAPDRDRGTERVADNHVSIAGVLLKLERSEEALAQFRTALSLRRQLVEGDPEDSDFLAGLAITLKRFGDALAGQDDANFAEEAQNAYDEATRILEGLRKINQLQPAEVELLDQLKARGPTGGEMNE